MPAVGERFAFDCDPPEAEPPRPWPAQAAPPLSHFGESESAPLSALAGQALGARFRYWRGTSGRRYIFSVYAPEGCPSYRHAVIAVVASIGDGERRVLFVGDTGWFPEVVLARAARQVPGWAIEFHLHLLANSAADRRALILDLSPPSAS